MTARRSVTPQRLLAAVVVASFGLSLAPARSVRMLGGLRDPAQFVLAPVTEAATALSRLLRPAHSRTLPSDETLAALVTQRDQMQAKWLNAQRQIDQLKSLIRELQAGRAAAPDAQFRPLAARVIGSTSDQTAGVLTIRAGRDQHVTQGDTVAVVNGVQLVGRVVRVDARTAAVLTITHQQRRSRRRSRGDEKPPWIQGLVFAADGSRWGCQLRATGDGRLQGDLVADARGVEPGQLVRLSDPAWPDLAQMLELGRIERIEPKASSPLRLVITVIPDMALERVRRVILRIPDDDGGSHDAPQEATP